MNWRSIRNPLTEADIDNLEHEFQIKLPGDYKSQLAPSTAAHFGMPISQSPSSAAFPTPGMYH